jgi:hypothetical protein
MPAATAITLNGVTFYAKDIKEERVRVGVPIRAANGKRRFALRAVKRQWTIEFDNLLIANLSSLRTIHALSTTFPYVDENAASITVLCQDQPLSSSVNLIRPDGTVYYNATIVILEA